MKICNYCGCENDDTAWACRNCQGNAFSARCYKCGSVIKDTAYCPNCGTKAGDKGKQCPRCQTSYFSPACPNCGYSPQNEMYHRQIMQQNAGQPTVVNNHYETSFGGTPNQNTNMLKSGRACDKSISLILCILFGYLGAHKFYEGKSGLGILYLFTVGLFFIGWIGDILSLLQKPQTYYV